MKLTFVDAGVLIAAARGTDAVHEEAMKILEDSGRAFASSALVRLEVLPKALHNKRTKEAEFYEMFFSGVVRWCEVTASLVDEAHQEAIRFGLSAMDALHVASAAATGADELVTTERRTRLGRVRSVPVLAIRGGGLG